MFDVLQGISEIVPTLAALLTPVLAGFGAYIAWQQWKINQLGFKEKLFDRRVRVYDEVHRGLSCIIREAKYADETHNSLVGALQSARFLFGKDVQSFIKSLIENGSYIRMYQQKLISLPVGKERSNLVDLEHKHLQLLTDAFNNLGERFEPYLLLDGPKSK